LRKRESIASALPNSSLFIQEIRAKVKPTRTFVREEKEQDYEAAIGRNMIKTRR
jgi:hypothetical protein